MLQISLEKVITYIHIIIYYCITYTYYDFTSVPRLYFSEISCKKNTIFTQLNNLVYSFFLNMRQQKILSIYLRFAYRYSLTSTKQIHIYILLN